MTPDRLGWTLIHSHEEYPEGSYATPLDQLEGEYKPGLLWHWNRIHPMREGGPYTLLFAWEGEIFGECTAEVTQKVQEVGYNFAFKLNGYQVRKSVKLDDLPVPKSHRDLIKLTPEILAAYRRLTNSPS